MQIKSAVTHWNELEQHIWGQSMFVQVVDTTGAGDCFTAAVVVGVLQGMSYQDALQFGGELHVVVFDVVVVLLPSPACGGHQ